jgi:hypothetical protein
MINGRDTGYAIENTEITGIGFPDLTGNNVYASNIKE